MTIEVKSNWVDDCVSDCSHVETPESWLWWSFLCCISAAAGNNYFVKALKGDFIYKPNLYIMLLGESGLGKGFPINRAKRLVQSAEVTRVIAGRSSIQAIVTELSTTKKLENKDLILDGRALIINGELSTAIIADPDALTILTDLFDGHYNPEWDNLLKGTGREKLKNPYITALFGSSPAHFYDSIPQANIEGGYIGRNLIIFEEKRSKDVDILDFAEDDESTETEDQKFEKYLTPKYVPHLQKIAGKKGRLRPTESARQLFNTWRKAWRAKQPSDKTGFLNRVPDHTMKVAMCLSLAEYDFNGYIEDFHVQTAIDKVTHLVYANKKAAEGRGNDPLANQSKMVLDLLLAAPENKLTRLQMIRKGYGHYDSFTFDKVIENLLEMKWVRREKTGQGSHMDWVIYLTGQPLEEYKKFIAGQSQKKKGIVKT